MRLLSRGRTHIVLFALIFVISILGPIFIDTPVAEAQFYPTTTHQFAVRGGRLYIQEYVVGTDCRDEGFDNSYWVAYALDTGPGAPDGEYRFNWSEYRNTCYQHEPAENPDTTIGCFFGSITVDPDNLDEGINGPGPACSGDGPSGDVIIANVTSASSYATCLDEGNDPGSSEMQSCVQDRNAEEEREEEEAPTEEPPTCAELADALGWVLCPLIEAIDSAMNTVDSLAEAMLEVDRENYDNAGIHEAWAIMRNIAYTILIPMTLFMVISTALGFDLMSAYTVRRALPRLIIAVIFIGLSYEICVFLIELSNVVGRAILGLMTSPFDDSVGTLSLADLFTPSTSGPGIFMGLILGLAQAAALIIGIILILVFFGSAIVLGLFITFIALLVRQLFIVALLMVSPLAIIAWIFPGNDRLWKIWWSMFTKLLLMFPIIMALLAVGRIFAFIIMQP